MEHFYKNIQGWFNYESTFLKAVSKFPSGSKFVEIGSWKGSSSAFMCVEIANSNKNIEFYCVDTWEGSPEHVPMGFDVSNLFEEFTNNMKPVENFYKPMKMKSVDAAKHFEDNSLDFIYIDGCHEYECVLEDIKAWLPKIKKDGIFAGHDFDWPGVKKAVDEIFDQNILVKYDGVGNGPTWIVDDLNIVKK